MNHTHFGSAQKQTKGVAQLSIFDNVSASEMDNNIPTMGNFNIVRDRDDGKPLLVEFAQNIEDSVPRFFV